MSATTASSTPTVSTADTVFQTLLTGIVSGKHQAGERLPAERELARQLGASRPTLREALRRLSQWHMVEAKRGSGVVVRERCEWAIEALPAYMRFGDFQGNAQGLVTLIRDLLELRSGIMRNLVQLASGRIKSTERSRAAMHRAWENRTDGAEFARAEFEMIRALAEAGEVLPAVWLMNSLGTVYVDLASSLAATVVVPDDFVESISAFLDLIDANEYDKALAALETYLKRTDERMLMLLGAVA